MCVTHFKSKACYLLFSEFSEINGDENLSGKYNIYNEKI